MDYEHTIGALDEAAASLLKAQVCLASVEGDVDFEVLMFIRSGISEALTGVAAIHAEILKTLGINKQSSVQT